MTAIIAFLIGAAIGYLGVRLGDLGEVAIGALFALVLAYYLRKGRIGSASGLALGSGVVIVFVLGSVVLDSVQDPAVHVEAPTYVGLAIGLLLAGLGVTLGVFAAQRRKSESG
jgi:hypothetical protein